MIITLKTLVDIYKPQIHTEIPPKLIKRNVECKKTFDTNNILVEQYIKPNGEISKRWCNIKEGGESYYRVKHSFEYVENLINPKQIFITGFKRYNNNK